MGITGLSPLYEGRVLVPVLAGVRADSSVDKVTVHLVSGQSPGDVADRAEGIAHGLGVHLCRVRPAAPGLIVLELVRRDALAEPIPALPVPQEIDPAALPVGRCEDGTPWLLRLAGTHVLIAGATGAGKGSVIWSLFCWENGTPPHPDTITRRFKKLSAAAGLPEIDLHDVRHSYATAGRNAKIDWKALSKRIGHADVAFTMKQYVQTDLDADRQVANTLAELIIGGALASFAISRRMDGKASGEGGGEAA
jgi:hypothetical protein